MTGQHAKRGRHLGLVALASALLIGAIAGCSLIGDVLDIGGGGSSDGDYVRGPILFDRTASSATIIGVAENVADVDIDITPTGFTDVSDKGSGRYEIEVAGLSSATTYTYSVNEGTTQGRSRTFRTPPSNPVSTRFAVYGDGRSLIQVHESVVALIDSWAPDFVMHVGDYVDDDESDLWRTEWFGAADDLMAEYVIYGAMGNHEEGAETFYNWLSRGSSTLEHGTAYSFSYGPAFFMVLNSTEDLGESSAQYQWAEEQLQGSASRLAPWRVVMLHHPPYWSSDRSDSPPSDVVNDIVPLLKQYDAQVLFTGHQHAYERLQDEGLTTIITGGGGSSLNDERDSNPPSISVVWEPEFHACMIDATTTTLTLEAVTPEGTQIDRFTLTP